MYSAFKEVFKGGFGIETDIRDCWGKIVISQSLWRHQNLLLCSNTSLEIIK